MRGLEFPFDSSGNRIPPSSDFKQRSNYDNFQFLKDHISHYELTNLTKHPNGVIRIFAVRELLNERDTTFNYSEFIENEIRRNDTIESQFGCIISFQPTYAILLEDLSGDWNSATYTNSTKEVDFLNSILRPFDNYLLHNSSAISSYLVETVFDRELFYDSGNIITAKILLRDNSYGAFKYLQKKDRALFNQLKPQAVKNIMNASKSGNQEDSPSWFWFFRYFVSAGETEMASTLLNNYFRKKLTDAELEDKLSGLSKSSIRKFKRNYR